MRILSVLIGSCLLLFGSSPTLAQPTEPRPTSWYQNNDQGNRYEGSYNKQVSNQMLEPVSFTAQQVVYAYDMQQNLQVDFFLPEYAQQAYLLKAEELSTFHFYWMEDKNRKGQLGWNSFQPWPVDGGLKEFRVDANNLGVLIRLGNLNGSTFVPAFISLGNRQKSGFNYILKYRLGKPIAEGVYTIYQGYHPDNELSKLKSLKNGTVGALPGLGILPIWIPSAGLPQSPCWITIKLTVVKQGGDGRPTSTFFSFYHYPDV